MASLKPEDILTDKFAALLREDETSRKAFMRVFVGPRVKGLKPLRISRRDRPPGKADILIEGENGPFYYVEAKLTEKIQPLQLIRARSYMRHYGQTTKPENFVLSLSCERHSITHSGWPTDNVVRNVRFSTWIEARREMLAARPQLANNAAWRAFWRTAGEMGALVEKTSVRIVGYSHGFGRILWDFVNSHPDARADFCFGAKIDPFLQLGYDDWKDAFGTNDVERLRIFFGPEDSAPPVENFRIQLMLWSGEFVDGRNPILKRLVHWNTSVRRELGVTWEVGGRRHADRIRNLPEITLSEGRNKETALLNFDGRVYWNSIRNMDPVLQKAKIDELVAPLISIVNHAMRGGR